MLQQGWGWGWGQGHHSAGRSQLPFLLPRCEGHWDGEPGPGVPRHDSLPPLNWLALILSVRRSPEVQWLEGGHCDELKGRGVTQPSSSANVEGREAVLHLMGDQAVETLRRARRPLFLGLHTLRCHWSKSRLCSGPMHVTPSDLLRSKKPVRRAFCFPETSSPTEINLMGSNISQPIVYLSSLQKLSDRQLTTWSLN